MEVSNSNACASIKVSSSTNVTHAYIPPIFLAPSISDTTENACEDEDARVFTH